MLFNFAKASQVQVTDPFWRHYLDQVRTVTVPHVMDKFEFHGALENFDNCANGIKAHKGAAFWDGLIYESIRGISDLIADHYDAELDARLDNWIARIAAAQATQPDGYINTNNTAMWTPENRWGDGEEVRTSLVYQHVLYDFGALIEAGVQHYLATGKTTLLHCGIKVANLMAETIGKPPKRNLVPGHALPEEALIRLAKFLTEHEKGAELTEKFHANPSEYSRVAADLIYFRGHVEGRKQMIADWEKNKTYKIQFGQDHLPIEEQNEAAGHSVRATLFYLGLASVGIYNDDPVLKNAAERMFNDIITTKLQINGGVGALTNTEAFGKAYFLPDDAYLETCAGVGMAFFAAEHSRQKKNSIHFDVFERALYNNVMGALGEDFKTYYYVNPLATDGTTPRWDWHACPCCPPMMLKLFGALKTYIWATDGDTVRLNLHIGSTFTERDVTYRYENGTVSVETAKPVSRTLEIRIPEYAVLKTVSINGKTEPVSAENGMLTITRLWDNGDTVTPETELPIFRIAADPRVEACWSKIAVQKGPYVYCAEHRDNPQTVIFLDANVPLTENGDTIQTADVYGNPVTLIPYTKRETKPSEGFRVFLKINEIPDEIRYSTEKGLYRFY